MQRVSSIAFGSCITCSLNHNAALADRGIEVVQADADDVESLERAFEGAYGVFGLTNCTSVSPLSVSEAHPAS